MGIYLSNDGISYLWAKIKNKFYTKPSGGIPKSDLASSVQASLGKADSALQSHQDISGKQDKSTAVTHTASTAVGSATKPVYVAANGAATAITHSINADVPANAKFTDTTYSDATQSEHGLMAAADKAKLDGMDLSKYLPLAGGTMSGNIDTRTNQVEVLVGSHRSGSGYATPVCGGIYEPTGAFTDTLKNYRSFIGSYRNPTSNTYYNLISIRHRNGYNDGNQFGMYLYSALTSGGSIIWNKQTAANTWQGERVLLDSANYSTYAAAKDHTHDFITYNKQGFTGANGTASWVRLGTLVSSGDSQSAIIRVWSGNGFNAGPTQNSSFEIQIKDAWQSTQSASAACGVTVYRINCDNVKVKVMPTAHNTYTVWVYLPWAYWNGNYAVYGRYTSWTQQLTKQDAEPSGTAADTSYYDYAFTSSTVANATTWNGLTQDCDTYNSADTWLLVKNGNKIQHRLSYELKVKEATYVTESAWAAVPATGGAATSSNLLKYKKSGNTVHITGSIRFSSLQSSPVCGTLPTGYRPATSKWFAGWSNDVHSSYGIRVDLGGVITLYAPSTASNWFVPSALYNIDVSFITT